MALIVNLGELRGQGVREVEMMAADGRMWDVRPRMAICRAGRCGESEEEEEGELGFWVVVRTGCAVSMSQPAGARVIRALQEEGWREMGWVILLEEKERIIYSVEWSGLGKSERVIISEMGFVREGLNSPRMGVPEKTVSVPILRIRCSLSPA